jgi:hypothetical protein
MEIGSSCYLYRLAIRGDTADSSGNNTDSFAVPSGWNYNTTYFLSVKEEYTLITASKPSTLKRLHS